MVEYAVEVSDGREAIVIDPSLEGTAPRGSRSVRPRYLGRFFVLLLENDQFSKLGSRDFVASGATVGCSRAVVASGNRCASVSSPVRSRGGHTADPQQSSGRSRRFLDRGAKRIGCPPTQLFTSCSKPTGAKKDANWPARSPSRSAAVKKGSISGCSQKRQFPRTLNPEFKIVLSQECLQKNGQIWVPKAHRVAYLNNCKSDHVTLVCGVHVFLVRLTRCAKGIRFAHGWVGFAEAPSFEEGRECVFVLVDKGSYTYDVRMV